MLNLTSQLVDAEERPVPLSDVRSSLAPMACCSSRFILPATVLSDLELPVESRAYCALAGVCAPLCVFQRLLVGQWSRATW